MWGKLFSILHNCNFESTTSPTTSTSNHYQQGRRHRGGDRPPKGFKKGKILKYGYFLALKLAFLTSLIRKYMLWEGFYHDFSTKKASASGGFAPWPPPTGSAPWTPARGRCPLDPRGNFAPSNDLPWRRPWLSSTPGVWVFKTL